ncbi:hypothetical protein [Streptomyces sp. NPDC058623]|uniref:hypothetical protein n=1 Tax=Streptomyces sp. NPDC058623 TaxID=3346563 RepID=UPI0036637C25
MTRATTCAVGPEPGAVGGVCPPAGFVGLAGAGLVGSAGAGGFVAVGVEAGVLLGCAGGVAGEVRATGTVDPLPPSPTGAVGLVPGSWVRVDGVGEAIPGRGTSGTEALEEGRAEGFREASDELPPVSRHAIAAVGMPTTPSVTAAIDIFR